MKKLLFILLCLPIIGFGQKIEEKVDDFTDNKTVTFTPNVCSRPLIDNSNTLSQHFLFITKIEKTNNTYLMTLDITASLDFNKDGYLWVLFEDGTKKKCDVEIYGDIIDFAEKSVSGYTHNIVDFYIDEEFIKKLANGNQINKIRYMTNSGYVDYVHTGFNSKRKEDRRKQKEINYYTMIYDYISKE